MVDRLGPVTELKDITLSHEVPAQVGIMGDPILIQNALRNLLDNTIKYSPAPSPCRYGLRSTMPVYLSPIRARDFPKPAPKRWPNGLRVAVKPPG